MPNVEPEIRRWLHQQQDWLQEAAEKLLASGSLSDRDVVAIAQRLKTTAGQQITAHRNFEGIVSASASSAEVHLLEIGDICGIENLCPNSPLVFGTGNLSVIYGPNGSGKSGYTRILKRACGKPNAPEIRSNVYESRPVKRECRIRYMMAGRDQSVTWQPTDATLDDLRAVDIFDADAAAFYISKEKAISYTPPAVTLFEELATVCDRVKGRLQSERNLLVSALPNLPPDYYNTGAGKAFAALRHDLSEQDIQRLTDWGKDNEEELEKLTERLSADEPAKLAELKRNTKDQLDQLRVQLKNAADAVSKRQVEALRDARKSADYKRKIATEAALLSNAKFDGVGTETWNALWEAARVYSQIAYPGRDYPVTEDGARCVLCHQELAQEAQNRLQEFETFVQGVVETEAKTAEEAYSAALAQLPKKWNNEEIRTRCEAAGLTEGGWTDKLGSFWDKVDRTCEDLLNGEKDGKAVAIERPDELLSAMAKRSELLERDALQNDEDAKNFDREQAGQDKLNLEARRWTAQQATAIRREIVRLKKIKDYDEWERLANSRRISLKAGYVAEKVITQAYVDRFNEELGDLARLIHESSDRAF